jgi:hypothetical protein
MAAGRDLVKRKTTPYEFFYAPQNVCAEIHKWLDGKFWLFNNEYGSEWELLQEKIRDIVKEQGVQLILLDNLMALDLDGPSSDNDLQTRLIKDLKELMAKHHGSHVVYLYRGSWQKLGESYWLDNAPETLAELEALLGPKGVKKR